MIIIGNKKILSLVTRKRNGFGKQKNSLINNCYR